MEFAFIDLNVYKELYPFFTWLLPKSILSTLVNFILFNIVISSILLSYKFKSLSSFNDITKGTMDKIFSANGENNEDKEQIYA